MTARCSVSRRGRDDAVGTYHLLGYHDNSLDGELPVAVVEQVLQAGAEKVDDQNVVEAFLAEIIDIRNPSCTWLVTQSMFKYACIYRVGVDKVEQNKR